MALLSSAIGAGWRRSKTSSTTSRRRWLGEKTGDSGLSGINGLKMNEQIETEAGGSGPREACRIGLGGINDSKMNEQIEAEGDCSGLREA